METVFATEMSTSRKTSQCLKGQKHLCKTPLALKEMISMCETLGKWALVKYTGAHWVKCYVSLLSSCLIFNTEIQTGDASLKTLTSICNNTPAGILFIGSRQSSYSVMQSSGIIACNKLTQSHPVSETIHLCFQQLFIEHQSMSGIQLQAEDRIVNEMGRIPCFMKLALH